MAVAGPARVADGVGVTHEEVAAAVDLAAADDVGVVIGLAGGLGRVAGLGRLARARENS